MKDEISNGSLAMSVIVVKVVVYVPLGVWVSLSQLSSLAFFSDMVNSFRLQSDVKAIWNV